MTEQEDNFFCIFTIVTSNKPTLLSTVASICEGVKNEKLLINFVFDNRCNLNLSDFKIIKQVLEFKKVKYQLLIRKFNGISRARNYGFTNHSSQFHIFLDDDVVLSQNLIIELKRILAKDYQHRILYVPTYKEYISSTNYSSSVIYGDNFKKNRIRLDPYYRSTQSVFFKNELKNLKWISCIGRCIIQYTPRADPITNVDKFDEKFRGWGVEDIEYSYRQKKKGTVFKSIGVDCTHIYHKITRSHLEELEANLFLFEKKYSKDFGPIAYRLFTYGKLTLSAWAKIERKLGEQKETEFYYMNPHISGSKG